MSLSRLKEGCRPTWEKALCGDGQVKDACVLVRNSRPEAKVLPAWVFSDD